MKSFVLFNNKGGVGKTTLTFNLAHMLGRQGHRIVVLDCDPQCNLSAIFLTEDRLSEIWEKEHTAQTVFDCIDRVRLGKGDVREPTLEAVADNVWLLPGHLALSRFEQTLAEEWSKKADSNNERALDVTTALDVLSNMSATAIGADVVMLDVGPSLGALNRAALLACDAVVLPMAPDLFSIQGLRNVGPTLFEWRTDWKNIRETRMRNRPQAALPPHEFLPIGYIVQQHLARIDRPVAGYARWANQIPSTYHKMVLNESKVDPSLSIENDPEAISSIKHFASLVPIAQDARKPLFDLKQADGIGGGQIQAVAACRKDFERLAKDILTRLKRLRARLKS